MNLIFSRQKLGSSQSDSILIQSLQNGLALEFERSDSTRRLRLVLSELLFISSQVNENSRDLKAQTLYIILSYLITCF
jgi:integrator complex subunit 2